MAKTLSLMLMRLFFVAGDPRQWRRQPLPLQNSLFCRIGDGPYRRRRQRQRVTPAPRTRVKQPRPVLPPRNPSVASPVYFCDVFTGDAGASTGTLSFFAPPAGGTKHIKKNVAGGARVGHTPLERAAAATFPDRLFSPGARKKAAPERGARLTPPARPPSGSGAG